MIRALMLGCFLAAVSGCTSLRQPVPVIKQTFMEQRLLLCAAEEASGKIFVRSDQSEQNIRRRIDEKQLAAKALNGSLNSLKRANRNDPAYNKIYSDYQNQIDQLHAEIMALNQQLEDMQKASGWDKEIAKGRLYINIQCPAESQYYFQDIIEKNLRNRGFTIANDLKDADYRLDIFVRGHGPDNSIYNFLYLYISDRFKGMTEYDVSLYDLKTARCVYAERVGGSAYYKEDYFLLIGPFRATSLERLEW